MKIQDAAARMPVAAPMAVVAVFAACLLAFAAWQAMVRVDAGSDIRDARLLSNELSDVRVRIGREQVVVTAWDDAVVRTRRHDSRWMEENLGLWMHTVYGHDRAYVLDADDRPVHAMVDGRTVAPNAYAEVSGIVGPLATALRAVVAAGGDPAGSTAEDVVLVGGRPAVVSIKEIVPAFSHELREKGREYLHVAFRMLDGAMFRSISDRYLISDIGLVPQPVHDDVRESVEIVDDAGRTVAHVAWDRRRPGLAMVSAVAPAVGVALLVGLAVIWTATARFRRSACRLRDSEARAEHAAHHDGLTGLPNRVSYDRSLDAALRRLRARGETFGVVLADVDGFKRVNDGFGHDAGDELLRLVAGRIEAAAGPGSIVARLGSDEFAVLLPAARDGAWTDGAASRIVSMMAVPFVLAGETVRVGCSAGSLLVSGSLADRGEVLRRAGIALRDAKSAGGGRFLAFDAGMDEVVRARREMERDMTASLDAGADFSVLYQPIHSSDGATVLGAEALTRWNHPVRGAVSPADFVPVAEERGLVVRLGEMVVREACRTIARTGIPWIAVNVSPVQLRDPGFPEAFLSILRETSTDPRRIQIEITEGVLLEPGGTAGASLATLRMAGIRVALDDFGTGYASIQYLSRYPVDKIKIDQSFVRGIGESRSSEALLKAMLDLARALDVATTAEGVETERQRRGLADLGCGELQGWLMSKAVTADVLSDMLGTRPKLALVA